MLVTKERKADKPDRTSCFRGLCKDQSVPDVQPEGIMKVEGLLVNG